jgi:hypothetical protein
MGNCVYCTLKCLSFLLAHCRTFQPSHSLVPVNYVPICCYKFHRQDRSCLHVEAIQGFRMVIAPHLKRLSFLKVCPLMRECEERVSEPQDLRVMRSLWKLRCVGHICLRLLYHVIILWDSLYYLVPSTQVFVQIWHHFARRFGLSTIIKY